MENTTNLSTNCVTGGRLYHGIADQLVRMIGDGVFPPGSRLPGERELAQRLKVSRVTVRDAKVLLQARGVIEVKAGSGARVLDESKRIGALPEFGAFELTEARTLIESEAAALAARDIGDESLNRLEACLEEMRGPGGEEQAELADRDFHLTIAAASGNATIHHFIEMLWKIRLESELVRKVYDSVCLTDSSPREAEHRAVLDALRARDPAAARSAMRDHFQRLIEAMLDAQEEQALAQLRRQANESRERYMTSFQV